MQFVADLHLHSKYSRAVSRDMVLPTMAGWAKKKGIDILTTSDWTHPLWLREIRNQLEEASEGLYTLKSQIEPLFLLSVEVSSIYSQGGKLHRIHNLIFAPSFATAEKIGKELARRGVNLMSDGRPIMGISAKDLLELVLGIDEDALLIPAHCWTPWFSLFGSNSGFDSIEECFGSMSKYIYAIETGLSSDPEMNWRIAELENRSILSFSDAHSPAKMGREATVFELEEPTYENIRRAIMFKKVDNKIIYTIEFYPEEGKYHYTGHRNCRVVQSPEETKQKGTMCPVCKRPLTVGVMHRVQQLAREISNFKFPASPRGEQVSNDKYGVRWIEDAGGKRPKFVKLVPLLEIIAEALSSTVFSGKVRDAFDRLTEAFGSEIAVLMTTDIASIERIGGPKVAEGVGKVRSGDIVIHPGYDGEYGKVRIWNEEVESSKFPPEARLAKGGKVESSEDSAQLGLF